MTKIELLQADITKVEADAIVNAANNTLLGGGGVDGAIHRAGGEVILEACLRIREQQGGCPTGEAVITTAGNLPARKIIHTVGPVWQGGNKNESTLLRNCYLNSLALAEAHGLERVAFPNISTGVYRFPKQQAAEIAVKAVREFESEVVRAVLFVCFDEENYEIYQSFLS